MISATIKLSNLQYLTALEQLVLSNLQNLTTKPKLQIIPFYNFVCKFIDILTQFSKLQTFNNQSQYQPYNLNSFLVDFYFRKFEDNHFEIYRQLFSFLRSWKKYTEQYEQARLFISLLTQQRNSKQMIKVFLKFRKCILKNMNFKILEQIIISHYTEDALAISHSLFSNNLQTKNYITKKINELFISLKRKLVNSAQINGAVLCEFYMACLQRFQQQNINNLFKQGGKPRKKASDQVFKKQNIVPLPLAQNQKHSINPELNPRHDRNYNLSFSEEYASYYSPNLQNPTDHQPHPLQNHPDTLYQNEYSQLSKEERQSVDYNDQSPIIQVPSALTVFKQRDRQLDQKLEKWTYSGRQSSFNSLQGQSRTRPQGWQNFLKANQETKKRLINKSITSQQNEN